MAARRARPVARALLALAVLALPTACSTHHAKGAQPRTAPALAAAAGYEQTVLLDGARGLWPLRDADGLRPRDEVAELTAARRTATVVGGTITGTTSPGGARAALFLRGGRIVTPIASGLTDKDAFTLEMGVRVDACTSAWGRVLGTTALTDHGREGVEVLHLPSQFRLNPCRLAVEFWHRGKHLGGCHPSTVPAIGRWTHLAVVYQSRSVVCYEDGVVVARQALFAPAVFSQPGPLGIGGSGSGFQGPVDGVSLSEVAVYDHPLTPAQVRAHAALLRKPPKP